MYMNRLLVGFGYSVLWLVLGYICWGAYTYHRYYAAFEATRNGDSLEVVLKRFGQPSHIEPHYPAPGYDVGSKSVCGDSCWIRLWYEIPFSLGVTPLVVDFDSHQVVIDKMQFSSP
jgi:hypothetical protein